MVSHLANLVAAFRMDDDLDSGDLATCGVDGIRREPSVDGAVTTPEDHPRIRELLSRQATHRAVWVVDHAVVQ